VANGPERTCSKARILTPSRARFGFTLLATLTSFPNNTLVQPFKSSMSDHGFSDLRIFHSWFKRSTGNVCWKIRRYALSGAEASGVPYLTLKR
jgi:hypothetical protein